MTDEAPPGAPAEVINLRLARKRRTREATRAAGDAAAAKHGRTRADRAAETARARLEARRLDAHRRDLGRDPGPGTDGRGVPEGPEGDGR